MRNGHRGEEDPKTFDWLYGTSHKGIGSQEATQEATPEAKPEQTQILPGVPASAPAPATADPTVEPTRVLGASPTPRATGPTTTGPATTGPATTGPATTGPTGRLGGSSPAESGLRNYHPLHWLLVILALVLAYYVVVPLVAWSKVSRVDAEPTGARPAEQPGTTYLLVGSDSREGLSRSERRRLGTGNAQGRRTDTIMLLHTGDGPNLLLSIPRDSLVEVPGHGTTKINAAFAYGGPTLLVRTIEQNTGIRVDDYVEIGFGGFVKMVDAVGGIEICPKTVMKDKLANLDIAAGCQEADGAVALGYARSRHTSNLGDIDRASHQREVVSAIGNKALGAGAFLNPVRYWRLSFAGTDAVRLGENVGALDFAKFALAMRRVDGKAGLTCGVPISDLAVHWDPVRSKRLFTLLQEDRTSDVSNSLCKESGLAQEEAP